MYASWLIYLSLGWWRIFFCNNWCNFSKDIFAHCTWRTEKYNNDHNRFSDWQSGFFLGMNSQKVLWKSQNFKHYAQKNLGGLTVKRFHCCKYYLAALLKNDNHSFSDNASHSSCSIFLSFSFSVFLNQLVIQFFCFV